MDNKKIIDIHNQNLFYLDLRVLKGYLKVSIISKAIINPNEF